MTGKDPNRAAPATSIRSHPVIRSAEEFVRLRESPDPEDRHRAAHEEAGERVWLDVVRRFPEMRFWVAQNRTAPPAVLRVLGEDADARVRGMVARRRRLPEDLLLRLARDPDAGVRNAVAYNAKASRAVSDVLAGDDEELVREAVPKQRQG